MQPVINFVQSHNVLIATLVIAILDFCFALNKNIRSNGIVHYIYLFFKDIIYKRRIPPGKVPPK